MILAFQAAPLVVLLALLASGRAGPIPACGVALLLALPAIALSLPEGGTLPGFLPGASLTAAWLALQPMAIVAGGLAFHAAVERRGEAEARTPTPARVFAVTLPLGAFLESVTGFAVGAVFALAALRAMNIGGAVAVALAIQALVLVPWGGLGPGTLLGATLAGVSPHEAAALAAWPNAVWIILLAPVLWWLQARAGVPVPAREKAMQALMLAVLAVLLIALHAVVPFEVVGVLASGIVAVWALWRADPPRELGTALRAAMPYLVLTIALLAARAVPNPPALQPFPELPAFPVTHVAIVLWVVAIGLLVATGEAQARLAGAMRRAARPMAVLFLYVLLGRWLAGGGVALALAEAMVEGKGSAALYAMAPMGFLAGLVTGSNVGANAALMPVQAALGQVLGLPALLAPAVHNFAGAAGAGMSVGVTAMLCALLADGTKPAQVWRLLIPSMLLVALIGTAALMMMRSA